MYKTKNTILFSLNLLEFAIKNATKKNKKNPASGNNSTPKTKTTNKPANSHNKLYLSSTIEFFKLNTFIKPTFI